MLCASLAQVSFRRTCGVLINYSQTAGYKKRQTHKIVHWPTFDEHENLPGDEFQTTYVGFYDDQRHTDPRAFDRFYRLNWGGWIRTRGGRHSSKYKKSGPQNWWSHQHILCSETQTKQLEQMFAQKYRKKTYFVDDFYEVYEERETEYLPYGHSPHNYSYVKDRDYKDKV